MKLAAPRWRTPFVLTGLLLLAGLSAPAAWAAQGQAIGKVIPSNSPPQLAGTTKSYSFELRPTSGQIGSFNLNAAAGWSIISVDSAPAGVSRFSSTQIRGRGLNVSSSSPLVMSFTAQAACASSAPTWGLVARSGGNFTGNTLAINEESSELSTPITDKCTAAFVNEPGNDRGPAAAAFNGDAKSENITSDAYTPSGAPMQVLVKDAAGERRAGILIELKLVCAPEICETDPQNVGSLSGPVIVPSSSDDPGTLENETGIATFIGSTSDPIAIDAVGIGYQLDPTGVGVTSTLSDPFGIWEEGEDCGATCEVHGRSEDRNINATVVADTPSPVSDLSVLVTELGLNCGPSIPSGYEYTALSADVIAWRYTGGGSQTITVRVGRDLLLIDRGSAHIDVCYLAEPHPLTGEEKTFIDKFGVVTSGPALLPDCDATIVENCILSQTAGPRGSRIVTFTVEDGRGKI